MQAQKKHLIRAEHEQVKLPLCGKKDPILTERGGRRIRFLAPWSTDRSETGRDVLSVLCSLSVERTLAFRSLSRQRGECA